MMRGSRSLGFAPGSMCLGQVVDPSVPPLPGLKPLATRSGFLNDWIHVPSFGRKAARLRVPRACRSPHSCLAGISAGPEVGFRHTCRCLCYDMRLPLTHRVMPPIIFLGEKNIHPPLYHGNLSSADLKSYLGNRRSRNAPHVLFSIQS